jgi:hypothetical protein
VRDHVGVDVDRRQPPIRNKFEQALGGETRPTADLEDAVGANPWRCSVSASFDQIAAA